MDEQDMVLESLESGQGLPQIDSSDAIGSIGLSTEQRGLEKGLTHEQFSWNENNKNNE